MKACNINDRSVVVEWFKALDWRCEGRGFESRHGTNILWQDINLHLLLSTQVSNGYPVGCGRHCWSNSSWASSNAQLECSPGSGHCAHSVCGQASTESNDRGNIIFVKALRDICIKRYIQIKILLLLLLLSNCFCLSLIPRSISLLFSSSAWWYWYSFSSFISFGPYRLTFCHESL